MHIIGKEEVREVAKVLESGQFMRYRGGENGYVDRFEKALCEKIGVKHALTVNSGTNALICAMVGLGLGPGDEVLVPAYTWVATAFGPLGAGAVPILVEVDETLMMDPADIERKITKNTKAIIPVHMANLVCNMDAIMKIARKHKLVVCEDACQAVGLTYKGKRVGSFGDANAYSFNQFKNMTCGEGGAIVTDDDLVYERMRIYHDTGAYTRASTSKIHVPFFAGQNNRASEIMGAILGVQLGRLDGILRGLRTRRAALSGILSKSKRFQLGSHNDPDDAVALTLGFPNEKEARRFAAEHAGQVTVALDSGRHVYTNWEPLLNQGVFHPKMNPYKWAKRKITYSVDMCPRTLKNLGRTCFVPFAFNMPMSEVRALGKLLLKETP
ncbi:MAG: DegT/DnrJ/EryC1/StrS family aminotransferase [Patescibacteria group bacterium]